LSESKNLVVHVELQDGAGQLGNNGDERIQYRQRVHIGANALGVHGHDERTAAPPGPPDTPRSCR